MNFPNFLAICLLVSALTVFLLGLFFLLSVPLKSPLEIFEETQPITGAVNDQALALVKNFPWLIPTFIFFVSTCLALLLAVAGLSIWHFVGRRRVLQIEQEASYQKVREEALQSLLDDHIGRLLGPADQQRETDVAEMARALQILDPVRRHRFDTFCRESRSRGAILDMPSSVPRDHIPTFHQKKILARILALGLVLFGIFMSLWSLLPLFFTDVIAAFYKETLGIDYGMVDAILAMVFMWILSLNPLGLAVGFLRLSSIESRLQRSWDEGHSEARDVLLASYRRQLESFTPSDLAPTNFAEALPILGNLTRIALPEFDASRRRTVLELLHGHGFLQQDGSALDLRLMDFSSTDLRKIVLHDACLRGFDLERAILSGADLLGADLSGARLRCADLRNSNLQGACLREADLRGARLHGANLLQAELAGAQLEGANLWRAKLRGVDLTHVQVDAGQLAAADC